MNGPVSVGIAGYGYWGPNLARNFAALPGVRLAAVCDRDPDRLSRFSAGQPHVAGFADAGEMLAAGGMDALAIATPVSTHHALALAALKAGKHVLVEKPMAVSTAECGELIDTARASGLTLMVGHTYLYSDAVRRMFEIIDAGEIGEVRYINCQRLNLGLFQQDIHVAWDLAPHDLAVILHVMGRMPETVNCQGNAHVTPGIEDVTNMSLRFSGGAFATIQSSWLEPRKVRQTTIVGSRGMIIHDDLQPNEKLRVYDVRVDCPPHYDNFAEFQYSYHYGECRIPHLGQREPLAVMCGHFVECILGGAVPLTPGESGMNVVRVLEACDESLKRQGAPVSIPDSAAARTASANR